MAPVVDTAPVGGPPHLRGHLVQREVERRHLVGGAGLGPDHRSLGERRELDAYGAVVLARIAFVLDLDLNPDDPVVVLLEPSELVLHVLAESL